LVSLYRPIHKAGVKIKSGVVTLTVKLILYHPLLTDVIEEPTPKPGVPPIAPLVPFIKSKVIGA
jgi:hypothetical protein